MEAGATLSAPSNMSARRGTASSVQSMRSNGSNRSNRSNGSNASDGDDFEEDNYSAEMNSAVTHTSDVGALTNKWGSAMDDFDDF